MCLWVEELEIFFILYFTRFVYSSGHLEIEKQWRRAARVLAAPTLSPYPSGLQVLVSAPKYFLYLFFGKFSRPLQQGTRCWTSSSLTEDCAYV